MESGLDGLIHISELRSTTKCSNSIDLTVRLGQVLSVQILGIDKSNKRISLKPATTQEEETSAKYLNAFTDGETYNPFASFLKKK